MERVLGKCDDQPAFTEDADWPGPGDGDNVTTKEETRPAKQSPSGSSSTGSGSSASGASGSSSSGSSSNSSTYFENCTAAREAGAAPVRRGDPGYGSHLDRDGDGIGCE
ncbi:Excalibur calcium-binding domain-containing protein [Brevibacterium linens ATCC 9172]|uniref:Excalibur calcium-binding domain-containing protein n=2 Tax=Brevibacterium linens TaxID=1703 RepID=A0A2H1KTB8_BRELN|nr:Excalibur calcium-binding domain-containing protein [Brevibacterium linens ATCC 9172]